MDPLRLVARVVFAYCFMLVLIRLAGKRTVKQSDMASFVIALIIGDMFDDLIWAEVPATQFVAGAGTIAFFHVLINIIAFRRGADRAARPVR